MIRVGIAEVKRSISTFVNRVAFGGERIILTSRGKPKAILLSVKEYERLRKKTGPQMAVLEEARCLREAFAARYGVLDIDLVRAAREEREARVASVLVSQESQGPDGEPDEPGR